MRKIFDCQMKCIPNTTLAPHPVDPVDVLFIKTLKEHICNNIQEPLRQSELAAVMHTSASALKRFCNKKLGMSPTAFVMEQRIRLACEQLSGGNKRLSQIGFGTGFSDHSHFTKQFKKQMGCTPSEYRSNHT
jgi:AraC-like DNA-binding protein